MLTAERKAPIFIVAASLCWSLGGLCIKYIPWGVMSIVCTRSALAALVFIVYRRTAAVKFTKGNILAALCLAATTNLFVFANRLATAAAAILLQFTAPIFIIVIELLFYRKKPKPAELIAVGVTILGMLLFFADSAAPGSLAGNIFALLSGFSFAGVFVCNKRPDVHPEQSVMLGFLINVVIGLPFLLTDGSIRPDLTPWCFAALLGIVQVGLAYVFFTKGIKKTSALLACLITALEPVLNPVWVALAYGEKPGVYAVSGGVVIVATVVMYNIWAAKHTPDTISDVT